MNALQSPRSQFLSSLEPYAPCSVLISFGFLSSGFEIQKGEDIKEAFDRAIQFLQNESAGKRVVATVVVKQGEREILQKFYDPCPVSCIPICESDGSSSEDEK